MEIRTNAKPGQRPPEVARLHEGFTAFASQTAEKLKTASLPEREDMAAIRVGLRDALDAGRLLRSVTDRGVPVTKEMIQAFERLAQATLRAYPYLQQLESERVARAGTPVDAETQELDGLVSSLRARCLNASLEIHRGLEAAYRSLFDALEES